MVRGNLTMKQKKTFGERIFDICNILFMFLLILITLYPFYYIVMASFSAPELLIRHSGVILKPVGFSTAGYRAVMMNKDIYTGYLNTIFYVVAGTGLSLLFSSFLAYALSRKDVKYSSQIMVYIIITMFFSGGMIPLYLVVKGCGLLNTRFAPILPILINVYNLIVMRTSFMSIPQSLVEAARIDGAGDFCIWAMVVMPLSSAAVAVFILFTGVGYWNSWFSAMIYIKDRAKFPLQLFLREILVTSSTNDMIDNAATGQEASLEEVIKYATIIVATAPILMVYPFLQKYFVKGVMVGAVKG